MERFLFHRTDLKIDAMSLSWKCASHRHPGCHTVPDTSPSPHAVGPSRARGVGAPSQGVEGLFEGLFVGSRARSRASSRLSGLLCASVVSQQFPLQQVSSKVAWLQIGFPPLFLFGGGVPHFGPLPKRHEGQRDLWEKRRKSGNVP